MEIIRVTNQKGGVGKTTTSPHLAIVLKKKAYKVLLVDFDQQGNLTYLLNCNVTSTIYNVITKEISGEEPIFNSPECDIIAENILLSKAKFQ